MANGQISGVLYAALDLTWLKRYVLENQLPLESVVTVVDRNGIVLSRFPDSERWTGHALNDFSIREALAKQTDGGLVVAKGVDGQQRQYTFLPIELDGMPGVEFYAIIGLSEEIITAHVYRVLVVRLIFLELGTLVLLGLALQFCRRVKL